MVPVNSLSLRFKVLQIMELSQRFGDGSCQVVAGEIHRVCRAIELSERFGDSSRQVVVDEA